MSGDARPSGMTQVTAGQLLSRVLRAAGIDAVYGCPDGRCRRGRDRGPRGRDTGGRPPPRPRPSGRGARLVGRARRREPDRRRRARCHRRPTCSISCPSSPRARRGCASPSTSRPRRPTSPRPPPAPVDRWREPDDAVVAAVQGADRPVVLAGPGVVADGAVPGLHALAAAASLGVLNTWGAKGVFDWRSRHHLATAGLQARDFALAGLGDADLIVATGVDPDEAPPALWHDLAPVVEVPPGALDPAAGPAGGRPPRSRCRPCGRSWPASPRRAGRRRRPRWPRRSSRATTARSLGDGGLVAADPGVRRLLGGAHVRHHRPGGRPRPGHDAGTSGFAAACAVVARLRAPNRPVLAVVDGSGPGAGDDMTAAVLRAAVRLGRRGAARGVGPRRPAARRPTTTSPSCRRPSSPTSPPPSSSPPTRPSSAAWSTSPARSWPGVV